MDGINSQNGVTIQVPAHAAGRLTLAGDEELFRERGKGSGTFQTPALNSWDPQKKNDLLESVTIYWNQGGMKPEGRERRKQTNSDDTQNATITTTK